MCLYTYISEMTLDALIGAGVLNRANTLYYKFLYYADFLNSIFMNINVKLDKNLGCIPTK